MAKRVTLDAMIPREDFGTEGDEYALDLFNTFPIQNLVKDAPILKLLRKPDFQRETNHWSPDQLATFVASFLDNEVIPGLILWKSKSFIFVIDGGHRLSALRAWMEDDYGDRSISNTFYNGEASDVQKKTAKHARKLVETRVGRFSELKELVADMSGSPKAIRAKRLFTRALPVQWIQGSASVAETSFFKINTQGTPLDETETILIENRRKPIAIGARAIIRAGAGHKYWREFSEQNAEKMEELASTFYETLFQPEAEEPLRTLELPLGGSVSPVDAMSLLIEYLTITGSRDAKPKSISEYADDTIGDETIKVLRNSLEVVNRITGDSPGSLGLHPAVYFYNERGKYSRFMFLAASSLIADRMRNNDKDFFKKFTRARRGLERFLLDNKSLIGISLQNMSKGQRVNKLFNLLLHLVDQYSQNKEVSPESAIQTMGLQGRIIDVVANQAGTKFSDDTKTAIFMRQALDRALSCHICGGMLDSHKSVSYDHDVRVRDGGKGNVDNGKLAHHYCDTSIKN